MTGGPLVREARPDELEPLTRLAEAAVPTGVVAAGGDIERGRVVATLRGDRVFVAEINGRRAGYAAVSECAGRLMLDQLVVAATDQGRHVGHTLLDWVEGYGVSRGLRAVWVAAEGADARAQSFYQRAATRRAPAAWSGSCTTADGRVAG